jgi:hypothetical protein
MEEILKSILEDFYEKAEQQGEQRSSAEYWGDDFYSKKDEIVATAITKIQEKMIANGTFFS